MKSSMKSISKMLEMSQAGRQKEKVQRQEAVEEGEGKERQRPKEEKTVGRHAEALEIFMAKF